GSTKASRSSSITSTRSESATASAKTCLVLPATLIKSEACCPCTSLSTAACFNSGATFVRGWLSRLWLRWANTVCLRVAMNISPLPGSSISRNCWTMLSRTTSTPRIPLMLPSLFRTARPRETTFLPVAEATEGFSTTVLPGFLEALIYQLHTRGSLLSAAICRLLALTREPSAKARKTLSTSAAMRSCTRWALYWLSSASAGKLSSALPLEANQSPTYLVKVAEIHFTCWAILASICLIAEVSESHATAQPTRTREAATEALIFFFNDHFADIRPPPGAFKADVITPADCF